MLSKPSLVMSRREIGVARRSEIVSTFAEMVAERGYDNVSIRDVAEALGLSKGTVVHHFTSKDRLLERVHADYMGRRLTEMKAILASSNDPAVQLACVIQQLIVSLHRDRSSTIAFAREIMRFASDDIMHDVRGMRREYYSMVREVLQTGMDDGTFRQDNAAIVALQIFGMANWSWTWIRPQGEWSADDIATTFIRTVLMGTSSRPECFNEDWFSSVRRIVDAAMAADK